MTSANSGATRAFDDKRERLLRAAARCFNEKGYSGTSLKDVAIQLGLTDAAIYYYIAGKQELVYQCYMRAADIGQRTLDQAIAEGGSGFHVARRYLELHVAAHCGNEGPIAIMSEIPSLAPEHREEILTRSRTHSRNFEAVLHHGIDDGSIVDCDVRMTGNAIMGAVNWIPKWFHGDPAVAEDAVRTFPDYLMRGLKP
ncbi:MAG: TetR/AcrR family transcriptional regulator [Pseudomonadota bacterium]